MSFAGGLLISTNRGRLVVYLKTPYSTLDNNLVENAIRPSQSDAKTGLSGTPEGAAAAIYSIIETAKANGLAYWYRDIFSKGYPAMTEDDFKACCHSTFNPPTNGRQSLMNPASSRWGSLSTYIDTIKQLENLGVGFRSITENIDTTSAGGGLIFHLFGALADFGVIEQENVFMQD